MTSDKWLFIGGYDRIVDRDCLREVSFLMSINRLKQFSEVFPAVYVNFIITSGYSKSVSSQNAESLSCIALSNFKEVKIAQVS